MENKLERKVKQINIYDQSRVEVSDCMQVISSTDKEVITKTPEGFLHIDGEDLSILKLTPEDGQMIVTGNILGVKFVNKANKKSLLKKVFK